MIYCWCDGAGSINLIPDRYLRYSYGQNELVQIGVNIMLNLDAAALLSSWEMGHAQKPVLRALNLLSKAWPEKSLQQWAEMSIGQRDARLLTLREELFGNRLESVTTCLRCDEKVELSFHAQDVRSKQGSSEESLQVELDGYLVRFRLPSSADLLAIDDGPIEGDTHNMLLKRCLQAVKLADQDVEPKQLPKQLKDAVIKEMANADPQADVQFALACPSCKHAWSIHFDILSYLWDEIDDWASRILREVHALALAYGWSEREILAMSSRRRQLYLEIAGK